MEEQAGARFFKNPFGDCGGVAQLGEHLPCKQGVKSSNLSISTRRKIRQPELSGNRTLKTAYG